MQWPRVSSAIKAISIVCVLSLFSLTVCAAPAAEAGQDVYLKAQSAWEKGEWDFALNLCEETLKINKSNKDAWLLKGQIYWQMKNYKMAVSSFEEYLKINPKNAMVWVNRGATLFELERYKDMQESYEEVLKLDPNYSPLYKNMGVNYLLMGNFEDAHKAFLKLEELGESSMYFPWTRRMLQITSENHAPPASWNVNLDSYQTVLDLADPSKTGYLVSITCAAGTAIRFAGSAETPFKYAPNFEVWNGAMIFDKKGDGLLTNGTGFRYKKITGDTLTIEEGRIRNWRMGLGSKKCFLITQ